MALPVTLSTLIDFTVRPAGPFKVGSSYYIVGRDDSTNTDVVVLEASDPETLGSGTGWEEQDSSNRPSTTQSRFDSVHAVVDGTTIHIVTSTIVNHRIYYHTFNTSTNAWAITDEDILGADIATGGLRTGWLGIRSDGDVIVAYNGSVESVMGTDYERVYLARRESASWTVDIRADDLGKNESDFKLLSAVMADQTNDRFHSFIYRSNSLNYSTYRSDNTFDTQGHYATADSTALGGAAVADAVSFDSSGTTKIRVLYENSDNAIWSWHDDDADFMGAGDNDEVNDAGNGVSAALAVDGTTLHALFTTSTDATVILHDERAIADSNWGTNDTELDSSNTVVVYSANAYDQGGKVLAYLYTDNGVEKYNERSLGGGIAGTMAVTEAADTAATDGSVLVQGTKAATEAADTAAFAGQVIVQGDLAATEAIDTLAASGVVTDAAITGDLAVTEAIDTAAISGQVIVAGDLVVTEAVDTLAASGSVVVQGDLAATEAADIAAISGSVLVQGDLAATEAVDTLAASGGAVTQGDLAATEGPDTATISGAVLVQGDLAATETTDTAAITGAVFIQGALAATEAADVLAASGVVILNAITGDLAVTEAADIAAFVGQVIVAGDLAATDDPDTAAISGAVLVQGDLVVTEAADIFAATAGAVLQGDLAVTEATDTAAFIGQVIVQGDLAATDDSDTAAIVGQVIVTGDLAATEATDALAASGAVLVQGDLAATEAQDTFFASAGALAQGDLAVTEGTDVAAISGVVLAQGDLAATESIDTAAIDGSVAVQGDLAVTEGIDTVAFTGQVIVQGDLAVTEAADVFAASGVVTSAFLNNNRISAMHFQRHYEPIAMGA